MSNYHNFYEATYLIEINNIDNKLDATVTVYY